MTTAADHARPRPRPDPAAARVAAMLRAAVNADCVILFGSRARGNWNEHSDIDLMVLTPEPPEPEQAFQTQRIALQLAKDAYHTDQSIDFVHFATDEFERKSRHTVNSVARIARMEGIIMPRDPDDFSAADAYDDALEYTERALRIGDANANYAAMHVLLDGGINDKTTAYCAQQTLEHAIKALLSALGDQYPPTHDLPSLAARLNEWDPTRQWRFTSDLNQLTLFAGGSRYGPLLRPVWDYPAMANGVTDDLTAIHQRIAELTGENPWDIPAEHATATVQPRYRE